MVNPVEPAANWFLGLMALIPSPIRLLVFVAAGFFAIYAIISVVRH